MRIKTAITFSAILLIAASTTSCKKKKGTGTGGGSSWIVGQDGAMVRLDGTTGEVSDYTLETDADLLDIACRGTDDAWVVGEQGTALRTFDGGESWEALDLDYAGDLRSVAASHSDRVYAAGDGPLLVSEDSGDAWVPIPGSEQAWTGVTTMHDGTVALGVTAGGDIYRYDLTSDLLRRVHGGAIALRAVSMTADGASAIAVGDDAILVSTDGGVTWRPRFDAAGVGVLHAVQLGSAGDLAIALGDGGAIARIGDENIDVALMLDSDLALRALHVSAVGHIIAVGDAGTALVSHDMGETWTAVDLGVEGGTWFGVDNLHGEPHL